MIFIVELYFWKNFIEILSRFYQNFISLCYGWGIRDVQFIDLIQEVKNFYKTLSCVECPAFGNEKVYFNRHGLRHLLAKERKFRTPKEIRKRLELLHHVTHILRNITKIFGEEKRTKGLSTAYFWTIKGHVGNKTVRIILRRLNTGTLHFFSIMRENTKPPEGGL